MKIALIAFACLLFGLSANAAQPTANVPISQMPITLESSDAAYFPLIQPYPGRTTNDNFRISAANLFRHRSTLIVTQIISGNIFTTNIYVTNLYAGNTIISNYFFTNITAGTIITTNLYVTNLYAGNTYSSNVYVTNLFVTGIGKQVWTNDIPSGVVRVIDPYSYVFVTDLFNNGWNVQFSKPVVLTNGTNVARSDLYSGLIIAGTTTNANDSIVQLKAGYFQGQSLKIISFNTPNVFKIKNGMAVDSSPGGVNIMNGDWVGGTNLVLTMTYDGLNWKEDGRYVQGGPPPMFGTNYWTLLSGLLQPLDSSYRFYFGTNATFSMRGTNNTSSLTVAVQNNASAILTPQDTIQIGAGVNTLVIDPTSVVASAGFAPYALDLGTKVTAFNNIWSLATNHIIGYYPGGVTNYSGLDLSHTGTNGVALYLSLSDGIAGQPRPHHFDTDNTVINGNLLEVANHGTNQITIGPLASIGFGASGSYSLSRVGSSFLFQIGSEIPMTITDSLVSVQRNTIGASDPIGAYGLMANNTTLATGILQQSSPGMTWKGSGYSTGLAAAETFSVGSRVLPEPGAVHPSGVWSLSYKIGVSADTGVTGTALQVAISTNGAALILPSMTKAQKALIPNLVNGMILYQTDTTPGLRAYVNGAWVMVSTVADP